MHVRRLTIILIAPLLLAACGGSSDKKAATTTTAPTTTTTARDVARDKALAESAVLKSPDLPPDWKGATQTKDPANPDLDKKLADCLRVDVSFFNKADPASADSLDFTGPKTEDVSNSVTLETSATKLREDFTVLEKPEMTGCLSQAIGSELDYSLHHPKPGDEIPASVTVGQAAITSLPFPNLADKTIAFRMTIPITGPGMSLNVYSDVLFAIRGRAGLEFNFTGAGGDGTPFPADLAQKLVKAVVDRLPAT